MYHIINHMQAFIEGKLPLAHRASLILASIRSNVKQIGTSVCMYHIITNYMRAFVEGKLPLAHRALSILTKIRSKQSDNGSLELPKRDNVD